MPGDERVDGGGVDTVGRLAGGKTAVWTSGSPEGGTTLGGDAARSSNGSGPAQRHAAHRHSSTTSGGGPADTTLASGRSSDLRASGSTPSATTQPRTRRPCSGTRTIVPTRTMPASVLGDEVVERARDRGDVGLDPADPRFGYASASAALRRTSASSVRSHVNVGSRRPKCPYAAVFW